MTHCPSCGSNLPPSAVSESLGAARCPSCRALVDLGASRAPSAASAVTVPIPEKWQVETAPRGLTVRWRWIGPAAFFLVPFTLFWNGILTFAAIGIAADNPQYLLAGLAVPHVWVGVGLAYYCLALFLNETTVQLAEGTLTVRHSPLPWLGKRTLTATEVQQFFVVEKRGSKGGRSYELCAMLRDGKRCSVVSGLADEAQARFLEVRLEQVLGLVDQRIEGEFRR